MAGWTIHPRAAPAASWSSVRQVVGRHPVATFLIICYAVNWAVVVPWFRTRTDILPFDLPLWGSLGTIFGVALPACLVIAATDGRAGVRDLARRSLRWRVSARWYLVALLAMPIAVLLGATALLGSAPLIALVDNWQVLFTVVLPILLLQIALFNLAEEIGWTGFLQARLQDRYGPLKASVIVTVPFALFHLPDLFVQFGLVSALVFLPILAITHLFARVVIMWLYNSARRSVLLVGLFHASFNATLAGGGEFIPGPAGTALVIATGVVVVAAVVLVMVTRGRLSYQPSPVVRPAGAARPAAAATGTTPSPTGIVWGRPDSLWHRDVEGTAIMYVTLFGDRRGTLPAGWIKETIVALLGDARIDATGSAGVGATLTFLGLAGDAVVLVPPGSRVTGGGLSVFGDRKIEVSPGDGPEIRVDGYSLFGDVRVSDQPST